MKWWILVGSLIISGILEYITGNHAVGIFSFLLLIFGSLFTLFIIASKQEEKEREERANEKITNLDESCEWWTKRLEQNYWLGERSVKELVDEFRHAIKNGKSGEENQEGDN